MNEEELKTELDRFIRYSNQLMDEYESYQLGIEERMPYLDMILRLNDTIRNYRRTLRLMREGHIKPIAY